MNSKSNIQHRFPSNFYWGTATAAHQIEGMNIHSDWWEWEKLPGRVKKGEHSGKAADHWSRLEEDVQIMKDLGVNAYRFTLEWSKIEPIDGEEFSKEAIQHYRRELELLKLAGIEPFITLHHFTSPNWFRAHGGWEWEKAPERFARFASFCMEEIAPHCKNWVTINEPMVHLGGGYVMGLTPPEKKGFENLARPLIGLIRSHAAAYRALHLTSQKLEGNPEERSQCKVGLAHHLRVFDPKSAWNPVDRITASMLDLAFNWTIPRAVETGQLEMWIPGLVSIEENIPEARSTQDYFGLNYYTRDLVTLGFESGSLKPATSTKPGAELNDLGWEIYPEGLRRVIDAIQKEFPGKSVLITENGIADSKDDKRGRFIDSHLETLNQAIREGIPIEGYFHWSLLDNFEWIEGFEPRFGLYEVDYKTFERRERASAKRFRDWIQSSS